MATYVIGDIHSCAHEFDALLKRIQFSPNSDQLYLVGDVINRGPQSCSVLERIFELGDACHSVLGNHDLAFLVYSEGLIKLKRLDTYEALLDQVHSPAYIRYLRAQPLIHYLPEFNSAICHAGLCPTWSIEAALSYSQEVQQHLTDNELYPQLLNNMFGNTPDIWCETLSGYARLRTIINYFSRLRYLHTDGRLDFTCKAPLAEAPNTLTPWFNAPNRINKSTRIIFGHWASLGLHQSSNTVCIDTGCVWGETLTAMRIDTPAPEFFHYP